MQVILSSDEYNELKRIKDSEYFKLEKQYADLYREYKELKRENENLTRQIFELVKNNSNDNFIKKAKESPKRGGFYF